MLAQIWAYIYHELDIYTCCMTPMIIANRRNVSEGLSDNCSYCLLTQVTPVIAN